MDRLVDYFAVVGYDPVAEGHDFSDAINGKVLTRIPEQDWENEPFMQGLELFCQPTGWFMTKDKHPPKYFVAVLTDEVGRRHYCAILSFSEPIFERNSPSPEPRTQLSRRESNRGFRQTVRGTTEDIDESMCEVDSEYNGNSNELVPAESNKTQNLKDSYMPKCLVLLSRHPQLEVFKNCLGLIYTIYIEKLSESLETVIAKLLTVTVPPFGTPNMRFKIGTTDSQVLQTPECEELPVTRSSVSTLLRHLGILNVMNVLTAALVDQKLLFYSCSYTRLSDSCNALIALMFPFSYSYPYIPILPQKLLECTSSPTPFLFGIHSSLRSELHDLVDVITVDLDGGVISVPECISIPHIPEPYYTQTVELLTKVLCPDLVVADYAYPPEVINTSEPEKLDKEIRAIFLRLFCQLLMGYRSCLQVCRIHPRPIIRFQKEAFLNLRGYDKINTGASANFMPRLVESQAFSLFVQERGPPYRRLNVFDQEAASVSERMKEESGDVKEALKHTKQLSFELYRNENTSSTPPLQKVLKPLESAYLRPDQTKFPKLSPTAVQTFMSDQINKGRSKNANPIKRPNLLVPKGPSIESFAAQSNVLSSSSRRLDVLKSCVQFIFESRNLETKKIFHAVLRTLKNRSVRGALAEELNNYAKIKPCLDNQQFEYIARLCNCALDDCSGEDDEFYVAADLLPILSTFYRKLCPTVMQFLYTVVQKPTVWAMPDFWSFMFFRDVQNEMCRLYQRKNQNNREKFTQKPPEGKESTSGKSPKRNVSSGSFLSDRVNTKCLEIAADELRDVQFKSEKETSELAAAEEGVIMSQIQHTAQLMIFLLVPLSETEGVSNIKFLNNPVSMNEDSTNSYFASSFTGSVKDSLDDDDDASYPLDGLDVKGTINKFVSAFVDRSCSITGISAEYSNSLLGKVSGLVLMQHESLQDVARESKNLPPIKKVKLMLPKMLPGEILFVNHTLRAYLAYDGRLTATGGELGGPTLLPAEGAIYVSNYRITFIGIPCDTLASEQVIIRSFPLSGLFKLKMFSDSDRAKSQKIEGNIQHWATLYSATFQLMLIGFDEDVDEDKRLSFEQKILSLRNPNTIDDVFAVSQILTPVARLHSLTSENAGKTGKLGIADDTKYHSKLGAKSLVKQAKKKAGMTLGKQQRLHLADAKVSSIYRSASTSGELNKSSSTDLRNQADDFMKKLLSSPDTMDSLHKSACVNDFKRLKILDSGSQFRMSKINKTFSVCKSYPVCSLIPKSVYDDSLRSISACHHLNRYPSVVWMHPKSKAILLRASAIRTRTAVAITKHGHSSQPLSDEGTVGSSVEVEKFFLHVISASKSSRFKKNNQSTQTGKPENGSANNEQQRKSPRQRGNNGFTSSFRDGRPDSIINLKSSKKWGTLTRVMGRPASEYLNPTLKSGGKNQGGKSGNHGFDTLAPIPSIEWNIQLYVFVDKPSIKAVKPELQGQVGFVCIDIPEPKQVRASFKSVLKCCLPVDPPPPTQSMQTSGEDTQMFRKGFETTGWMQQVSSLLTSAITVVNMLDSENASVMFALESGWDATPQLSSLVQLLLDPYYRTLSGFQTLLQKEWFSFGHRFSHRNHFNDIISTGFTPIFLQFLDCVYQIMCQFPLAFEFNLLFLQTLAYHCTSNRFQTFILDSDYERLEAGILIENEAKKQEFQKDQKVLMDGTPSHHKAGDFHDRILSVWKYVNRAKARSQVFQNALHVPNKLNQHVLRPISTVCRLSVWSYFTQEALADCPIYDGLLGEFFSTTSSPNEQETPEAGESWGIQSGRRVVNPCYDNVFEVQPDAFRSLKQQIDCLLNELGKPPQSWQEMWSSATKSVTNSQLKVPLPVHYARQEAKLINKRISSAMGLRTVPQDQIMDTILFPTPLETLKPKNSDTYNMTSIYQLQTTSEVRTYEGTLWKRGAYMKAWKQKYFVLDSTKHQLRQYESKLDATHKSVFDMKEVESVRSVGVISGAPKGVGNDSFFELKTSKRLYYFSAEDNDAAKKWIEALQNALEA